MRPTTATLFAGAMLAAAAPGAQAAQQCDWPAYRLFVERVVQADGRVIDRSTDTQQTTSEGQSYAMFFALVANDRATFDRVLNWTRTNLSANQFDAASLRLPAWQWGKRQDGSFGVIDSNSASDSDVWIAYDLFQAGRLWKEPAYTKLAYALATQIVKQEVADLPGLGPMLLPGPQGFRTGQLTRLNPGYLPLPVLRGLAQEMPDGPWTKLAQNAAKMIRITSPRGYAPDWAAYQASGNGQFVVDPKNGDVGSYDAIRVYLWAGMASPGDPLARPWLDALGGMRASVAQTGFPPEKVSTMSGAASGEGPLSYWAALAPYFKALNDERGLGLARARLEALAAPPVAGREPVYYDRVLGLFGGGFIEGRFRFDDLGRLVPTWRSAC
ncbi:cellulose synthase complex periplasmic endoglucanase BcsZ [Caballeronia sp. AZ10_KS36]|uniref:cellulose synthase complex periplasmic endoglucanase BcsZ n=1 Tax=Caballeronia sp. AZ10_KS36 TaxID=2921757 RepID=UPI002028255E|nr:cellulose synthase complex periplasmic endoglucanase BcsZ [Caballeronia sp. AZ10_KS36]